MYISFQLIGKFQKIILKQIFLLCLVQVVLVYPDNEEYDSQDQAGGPGKKQGQPSSEGCQHGGHSNR